MWTKARLRAVLALTCLGWVSADFRATATETDSRLLVSLTPQQETFSLHEPVIVILRIDNGTQRSIEVDLGHNFKSKLVFNVRQPNGRQTVRFLPWDGTVDGLYISGDVALRPGETHRQLVVLNEWETFDQVGSYQVSLDLPPSPSWAALGAAPSASARFTIEPRDPVRLVAACEQLAEIATHSGMARAEEAGHALSFANDEACLPSLVKVLKSRSVAKQEAMKGLAKLPTPEAVDAMVDAWDGLNVLEQFSALGAFHRAGKDVGLEAALRRAGKNLPKGPWG